MALPTNVSYGTVTGRFLLAYADSSDVDPQPDGEPAKGYVIFTASPIKLLDASASPAPVTILPAPVVANLNADGYIEGYAGNAGVRLVATNDPDLNPLNWTWRVDFRLTDEADVPVALPSFSFELPADTTVDLTTVSPVPTANGTFYIVGPTGATGPANTLTVGTVTASAPGGDAEVDITGTAPNQTISFVIPRGIQGEQGIQGIQGIQGPANELTVGTVTTSAAGSSAVVDITGTSPEQVINFTIPRGDKGDKGDQGEQGIQGIQGIQGEKGDKGDKGDTGDIGPVGPRGEGLTILGTVPTSADLPTTGNQEADAYITADNGHLWIWTLGTPDYWLDAGQIQGPPGEGVPTGGVANEFLVKLSSTDYDTAWSNEIDGGSA